MCEEISGPPVAACEPGVAMLPRAEGAGEGYVSGTMGTLVTPGEVYPSDGGPVGKWW